MAFFLYRQSKADPAWYPKVEKDPEALERAAAQVENTLIEMRNWAGAWAARDARAARATQPGSHGSKGAALPPPAPEFTAVLKGEDLTAFVLKWTRLQGWDDEYRKWVEDPAITVVDGRVVVVGRVKEAGATVSLHYRPELVKGSDGKNRLAFHLERVMLGRLTVPISVGEGQLERLTGPLAGALAKWRSGATLNAVGLGNNDALLASMGNVARGLTADVPVADVGFVPVTEKAALPVTFTKVEMNDREIRLTLRPVALEERGAFMVELKRK